MHSNLVGPAMARLKGDPSWSAMKAELQRADPWLKAFETSFGQRITAHSVDGEAFDPFQVKSHFERADQLVTVLAELENLAFELEINAVRSAADYQLALEDGQLALDLEKRRLRLSELQAQTTGFGKAAALFDKAGEEARACHERTLAESSGKALSDFHEAGALLNQRFELRKAYEELFHKRHMTPGNGHNYAERFEQIVGVAGQIYVELVERLTAVATGLDLVFGFKAPPLVHGALPSALRQWLEMVRREAALLSQAESEFTLVVPLTQPWGRAAKPLISPNTFDAAMQKEGTKRLNFDLSDIFPEGSHLRLLAVGVALDIDFDKFPLDRLAYFRAQVMLKLPEQDKRAGVFRIRTPVRIANAGIFARSLSIATESNAVIENISPKGKWGLELNELMVGNSNYIWAVSRLSNEESLKDIKLFLRCRQMATPG